MGTRESRNGTGGSCWSRILLGMTCSIVGVFRPEDAATRAMFEQAMAMNRSKGLSYVLHSVRDSCKELSIVSARGEQARVLTFCLMGRGGQTRYCVTWHFGHSR